MTSTSSAVRGDTIFALSSGAPPSAIAIVRISGNGARDVLSQLAGRVPAPRHAVTARLRFPDGMLLDQALILWMPGPASATGEDVAELHLHGGRAVISAALNVLSAVPECRQALPGEFTRRAFLNGRIDLAEAEGLADLLAAETEQQRRSAAWAADGGLSRLVSEWDCRLLAAAAALEAEIEFAEEEPQAVADPTHHHHVIDLLRHDIATVLSSPPAERLRDGIRVVIAGPPNAGKSTLLNALAEREAAIASPIAGTTRDLIEVPVSICGVPFILMDSAGLSDAPGDTIEQIGIERAKSAIEIADVVMWLGDPADAPSRGHIIVVFAKADILPSHVDKADVTVSAVTGLGIAELRACLLSLAETMMPTDGVSVNIRQRDALRSAMEALKVNGQLDLVLLAEHVRSARAAINVITGRSGIEEMLDSLFSSFCIGK